MTQGIFNIFSKNNRVKISKLNLESYSINPDSYCY